MNRTSRVTLCESDDEDTVHVLSVRDSDGYWVTSRLENKAVRMQVDTGTRVSMVSEAVYKEKLQHLTLRVTELKIRTYTGEAVPVLGLVDVTVEQQQAEKDSSTVHHSSSRHLLC